jgi:hypothetical protein
MKSNNFRRSNSASKGVGIEGMSIEEEGDEGDSGDLKEKLSSLTET